MSSPLPAFQSWSLAPATRAPRLPSPPARALPLLQRLARLPALLLHLLLPLRLVSFPAAPNGTLPSLATTAMPLLLRTASLLIPSCLGIPLSMLPPVTASGKSPIRTFLEIFPKTNTTQGRIRILCGRRLQQLQHPLLGRQIFHRNHSDFCPGLHSHYCNFHLCSHVHRHRLHRIQDVHWQRHRRRRLALGLTMDDF